MTELELKSMAVGIRFAVPHLEFVAHLIERAEHHQQRAEHYANEADKFDRELGAAIEKGENVTERLDIKSSSNYSNLSNDRSEARRNMQSHIETMKRFFWYSAHVPVVDVVYLSQHEVTHYEFTK